MAFALHCTYVRAACHAQGDLASEASSSPPKRNPHPAITLFRPALLMRMLQCHPLPQQEPISRCSRHPCHLAPYRARIKARDSSTGQGRNEAGFRVTQAQGQHEGTASWFLSLLVTRLPGRFILCSDPPSDSFALSMGTVGTCAMRGGVLA